MEWGRIKTILIWVFTFVNIFLFVVFFKGIYSGTELSDEVVTDTITVLSKNNVRISRDEVPKTLADVKICSVENKHSSASSMLEYARNFSAQKGVSYLAEENTVIDGNVFTCTVNSNKSVTNILEHTKSEMRKTGLLEGIQYTTEEKNGYIYFHPEYDSKIFYDCYLRVKCTNSGIQEIYGHNWLGDTINEGGMAKTVSPAEILIDFAIQMDYKEPVTIINIESGYYVGDRTETVRVTASPVWEIIVSDGRVFYYDMRNGDLLNSNEM